MSFVTKEWKDRLVEYAGRRKLKNVATGEEIVYDVSRQEGAVSQAGDAFAAETMNDLEQRISDEFNQVNQNLGGNILSYNESEDAYYIQYGADSVPKKLGNILPKKITYYYDYSNNSFSGWTNSASVAAGKYLVDVHIGHRSGNNYVCNLSSGQKLLGQSGTYGSSSLYMLELDKETVVTASCTCSYTGASDGFGGWVVYAI